MKKKLFIITMPLFAAANLFAQSNSNAGTWKTWFISSGREYRLSAPPSYTNEIAEVVSKQKQINETMQQQILFWNTGSPGYRWQEMINKLWTVDTNRYAIFANVLLGTAIYDATVAAWDTKYAFNRPRPFKTDKKIKAFIPGPESPSYPCEYSVAAGVAVTIFSKFYPMLADSVNRMAQRQMESRIAAGLAFPSDTRAGFELGKKIAEAEIAYTKDFISKENWDGNVPQGPGKWKGRFAMYPTAGKNKPVVLTGSNQFRPGPPPDFTKDMAELKSYKQTFSSLSNAFYWANYMYFMDELPKMMFERNIQQNALLAARINAIVNITSYDCFIACWDAKYTYWGIRPNQLDTTFKPAILVTPPFPGYPSGHAAISAAMAEVFSYFFPENTALFHKKAKDAAESRFQAGIHFRTDNEVATELGKNVGDYIIQRLKQEGDGNAISLKK